MMLGQIGGGKSDFTLSPGKKIVNISGLCLSYFWPDKIMPQKLKILTGLLVAALLNGAAFAASFTAALDRDTVTLGENATLSLKFEGMQPQDAPALPSVTGLQFQYVGPSSSFSFINGQTSSSITYNYIVAPQVPASLSFRKS